MKKVITAIGNEILNKVLKRQEGITVVGRDIQYQEGIIEAMEKYKDIDIVILNENLMGELNIEELLLNIVIIKKNIEIIVIVSEGKEKSEVYRNSTKVVTNNKNYVNAILEYLLSKDYIIKINETNLMKNETLPAEQKVNIILHKKRKHSVFFKIKESFQKKKKRKNIIIVIGYSGSRKDNCYFSIIKISKE